MLDTITATLDEAPHGIRSLVDRDEFGPIVGQSSGLFTVPLPAVLAGRDDLGHPWDHSIALGEQL
jgi:hypothetical protein